MDGRRDGEENARACREADGWKIEGGTLAIGEAAGVGNAVLKTVGGGGAPQLKFVETADDDALNAMPEFLSVFAKYKQE